MNKKEPLLSVIVPIYKVEMYLEKCIDSILHQTYKNIEIILVNDGSPDQCTQICNVYEKQYPNIFAIHKENGGLSSARNAGIKNAHGELISFIDSDDYIEPLMYEHMVSELLEYDVDIVVCGIKCVDENGTELHEKVSMESGVFSSDDIALWILQGHWEYVTVWNKIYRADIIKGCLFPVGKIHEDEFTVHHFLGNSHNVAVIPEKYYYYVMRSNSIVNSRLSVRNFDAVDAYFDRYEYYNKCGKTLLADMTLKKLESVYCKRREVIKYEKKDRIIMKEIDRRFYNDFIVKSKRNFLWKTAFKVNPKIYCVFFKVEREVSRIRNVREIVKKIWYQILYRLPVQKQKIVFSNFCGRGYGDNPKYIAEEIIRQRLPYDLVWVARTLEDNHFPKDIRIVRYGSKRAMYEYATARMWIDNVRNTVRPMFKKRDQYYIQTWHAGITMKKVEKDAIDKLSANYLKRVQYDSSITDLLLSGSKWNTINYRNAFWYNGEILECGLPRSDAFFVNPMQERKKIEETYGVMPHEKIILYAPTFRENENEGLYCMDFGTVLDAAAERWGGTWKILVRLHPNVKVKENKIQYSETVMDGSLYPDISSEIIASDLLITDYSSCMFDAINIHKKVILFVTDIEEYLEERGTYFSFNELPFPFAKSDKSLEKIIQFFDEEKYEKDVNNFLIEHQIYDDGHSSERVVKRIKSILK